MLDNINTNIYKEASEKFLPDKIRVLFIAESPPANESFFFFKFAKQEILLTTLTTAVFGDGNCFTKDDIKNDFLKKLKGQGYFLIDAVEYPINNIKGKNREPIIREESENLLVRLNELKQRNKIDSLTKIILIKVSVFNVLHKLLKEKGYNVLNNAKIDFPKYYNDRDVIREIRRLLKL